jgi:CheY-like chemotaxis protein
MTSENLVLVVDDEPEVREYLSAILEDAGFDVATAADGNEALRMMEQRPPDFISLDLVMPDRSGMKLLYALRKNREWSRIPVMIVTGHAQDELGREDMDEVLRDKTMSGPGTYLEKPVRPEAYVGAIRRRLGLEEVSPATTMDDMRDELARLAADADPVKLEAAVRLLRGDRPASGDASTVAARPELEGKRILVVDDEPDVAAYIAAILSDHGCRTVTAGNAVEAAARLQDSGPFDLATLDIEMPGKSGIRLYRELRSDPANEELRVVVITGVHKEVAPLFEGKKTVAPLDGFLAKPFEPDGLVDTVAHALGG